MVGRPAARCPRLRRAFGWCYASSLLRSLAPFGPGHLCHSRQSSGAASSACKWKLSSPRPRIPAVSCQPRPAVAHRYPAGPAILVELPAGPGPACGALRRPWTTAGRAGLARRRNGCWRPPASQKATLAPGQRRGASRGPVRPVKRPNVARECGPEQHPGRAIAQHWPAGPPPADRTRWRCACKCCAETRPCTLHVSLQAQPLPEACAREHTPRHRPPVAHRCPAGPAILVESPARPAARCAGRGQTRGRAGKASCRNGCWLPPASQKSTLAPGQRRSAPRGPPWPVKHASVANACSPRNGTGRASD
ncbi:hypothetical protein LMG31884_47160 (plasmid) [Xanthomonas hydrangeae]|nr:hypothetical protein LMG31884_47160 [Xanthomonas hydrangeae]CAD7741007.1 hypothetical protein LMG31884_47160 [Xanthomonas hydrangeae]CAD7747988.1 hypothetical protein LMG31887_46650 [Xanthomonas hydrangeae]CAD7747989.1 hypothetical protein LMG31887_46650 [Xanthomonas hydrangeae]CAD7748134.1 hypothetical protein LMG31885_44840 [Xanthomonas hydrangeae]